MDLRQALKRCKAWWLTSGIAITFLCQWHPLIVPERNDLRPEYVNGPAGNSRMF